MSPGRLVLIALCWSNTCLAAATTPCTPQTDPPVTTAPGNLEYAQGLYWQVSHPNSPPSFIYGTIHLDWPQVTRLPPRANLAFAHASMLITEVNLDTSSQNDYAQAGRLGAEQTLAKLLGAEDFARLTHVANTYGISGEQLSQLKPWVATNLIARPPARSGVVLDEALQERAKMMEKPIMALESMAELIKRLDGMPMADQLTVLRDAICQHSTLVAEANKLYSAYRDGDLARIVAANAGPHDDEGLARRFQDTMLWQRNELMVERLATPLKRGNVFVAIGALHLPGERGILRRLVQRGYTVTNISP